MADVLQVRRDTTVNWESANPVLADGEIGFDKTTKTIKVGDGVTAWNALAYNAIPQIDALPITKFYYQSNFNIDGNNGNYFWVTATTSLSFTLNNIEIGVPYYFYIHNSSTASITVTFPNTADLRPSSTFSITKNYKYVIGMIYDGIMRTWFISARVS